VGQLARLHANACRTRQPCAASAERTTQQVEFARTALLRQYHHAGHAGAGWRRLRFKRRCGRGRTAYPWRQPQCPQHAVPVRRGHSSNQTRAHVGWRRPRRRWASRAQIVHIGPDSRYSVKLTSSTCAGARYSSASSSTAITIQANGTLPRSPIGNDLKLKYRKRLTISRPVTTTIAALAKHSSLPDQLAFSMVHTNDMLTAAAAGLARPWK